MNILNIQLNEALATVGKQELRIKDLELKLLKCLGHNEFICEGIKSSISIYEDKSWFYSMSPESTQKRLVNVMKYFDINNKPEDYLCAMDLLEEVIWKISI